MKDILYTAELKGKLKLSRYGEWYHEGKLFERKALADLFHRSIVWDPDDKEFFIKIGRERARFECEDVPFFVSSLVESSPTWSIKLLGGALEPLPPQELTLGEEGQIYCTVYDHHKARLTRAAHQQLLTQAIDESTVLLGNHKFHIVPQRPQ